MSFKHGKSTGVYFGSRDLSPYLNSAEFGIDTDASDTTTFGSTWQTNLVGIMAGKAGFQGFYDPTVSDLTASLGVEYGQVLTFAPAGALAIGDRARLLAVASSSYGDTAPVGGVVGIKWEVTTSGAVGFADVLHILAEDTNTTTGAEKDDTAATALGWIAHLHVIAVDGGSWVIKLQDAAVSNTYTDLTGGAFTAATGATSQRLVSATTTTTLRRYVRYVATRTGGAGGDGITFLLAYSRNS